MTNYALLFSGQGSQYVGMGKSFFDTSFGAKLCAQAEEACALPLKRIMLEGPFHELTKTAIAQPAILLHSYAAYEFLREHHDVNACSLLGHSLGEYSALVAAHVINFAEAIYIVHKRGQFMQEAVSERSGIMAAVLGLDASIINEIMQEFADPHLESYAACANYNGPAQTVIAGTELGVKKASERLKLAGAKRVIQLEVSAPFHCALMKPVQEKMAELLRTFNFNNALVPIISNVSAMPESHASRIKKLLLEQIASPVRFTECVNYILSNNLEGKGFIELGPKNTLSGIIKKINAEVLVKNIDNMDDRI